MRAGLSSILDDLVLRMLEKQRECRPASAAEVRAALAAVLRDGTSECQKAAEATSATPRFRMPDRKYVAVLPFRSQSIGGSGDERGELLADGLAEAVSMANC